MYHHTYINVLAVDNNQHNLIQALSYCTQDLQTFKTNYEFLAFCDVYEHPV